MSVTALHLAATRWLSFALDGHRCALPLESVSRVVRAAEVPCTPTR